MEYTDLNRSEDFQWFLSQYDTLWKKYGHKIFVIKNKEIVGIYDDKNTAINESLMKYNLGSFIVQECNGKESGYTNYITSWELIS